jgi:hypothetical protein
MELGNNYKYYIEFDSNLEHLNLSKNIIEEEIKRKDVFLQYEEYMKKLIEETKRKDNYNMSKLIYMIMVKFDELLEIDINEKMLSIYGRLNKDIDELNINEISKILKKENKIVCNFLLYVNEKFKNGIYENLNIKYLKSKQILEKYNLLIKKKKYGIENEEGIEDDILYLDEKEFDKNIIEIYKLFYPTFKDVTLLI